MQLPSRLASLFSLVLFLEGVACGSTTPGFAPGDFGSGGSSPAGDSTTTGPGPTTGPASGSSSGGSGGGGTEDYTPDAVACINPSCDTGVVANCCVGIQPEVTTGLEADDAGCPSNSFPNNWSCDGNDFCVHGGCQTDIDCNSAETGLSCKAVGTVGYCVLPCVNDTDCPDLDGNGHSDMLCTGDADDLTEFCEQSLI